MDDVRLLERLVKAEEQIKAHTDQLKEQKTVINEIHNMSQTMVQLTEQVKYTNDNVEELKQKVGAIEKEPSARLTQIKTAIISALASALVTGIVGAVIIFS